LTMPRLILATTNLADRCVPSDGAPVQSVLHPAGPNAAAIAWLWWLMFWTCAAVFALVLVLLAIAMLRRRGTGQPTPPLGNKFIAIFGIAMPAVVLVGILIANLYVARAIHETESALTIRVTGYRWWWKVEYPEHGIVDANELYIPVGKPVRLELRAADVIHSFWVPRLAGKMDMTPGIDFTNLVIRADKPGTFRGQCAEFCGLQHALMAFNVVALPPAEFDEWVARRRAPRPPLADDRLLRGKAVFAANACGNCHAVRDTEFTAQLGPDLTHIASRLTLGAGTVPNNRGNLEGWVSNPQPIKPGNLMPPTYLSADDLHALTDYLESLK
jgi:cytochrome c oxidase subunit 2